MLGFEAIRTTRRRLRAAFLVGMAAVFPPALAHGHFILVAPDSWMSQDSVGLPEKLGPCGNEGGGTPTGKVTAFGYDTLGRLTQKVTPTDTHTWAYDQARAGYFPTVAATGSVTRSKSPSLSNQPSFATGAVDNFSLGVNASWELDLWGRVRRSVEAGEANYQASDAQLEAARLSARAALAQNYFALRVADVTKRLLEDTVKAYARSLELTQNRYQSGVAARVDVVQAEVQLKSAQARRVCTVLTAGSESSRSALPRPAVPNRPSGKASRKPRPRISPTSQARSGRNGSSFIRTPI